MITAKLTSLLYPVFFILLLMACAARPCRAETFDRGTACQRYECEKKAAEYTYNLDKAGDTELIKQHVSACMELPPPEKCLPLSPLKLTAPADPATVILQPNPTGEPVDLEIKDNTTYVVSDPGTYRYRFINIHSGGKMRFDDGSGDVHFWAKSILVENEGTLQIGAAGATIKNRIITLHLYGSDKDKDAIVCKLFSGCVPGDVLDKSGTAKVTFPGADKPEDYFYKYKPLITDEDLNVTSYFGRKVIAVAYGGTLLMFGGKGIEDSADKNGGKSWVRLDGSLKTGDSVLKVEPEVDWQPGDRIVVTTTDFLPSHSEQFTVQEVKADKKTIVIKEKVNYPHNGIKYDLSKHNIPATITTKTGAETRAAVALLSRNIRIVSGGTRVDDPLPDEKSTETDRYLGGHLIVRQGFKQLQMQGVELYQLGQGGRMAHVPVNFFLTRKVPSDTFVKDCSIWDAMNHWMELRGTQGVTLQRNVGYLSIGHGFVLADGTEANNSLLANIGIYTRPGADYRDNPRKVPGVLTSESETVLPLQNGGDIYHPTTFFIMNAFNRINDNMAAGAGGCGSCYWYASAEGISGFSKDQRWEGMAGILNGGPGSSTIQSFKGNFCSTAAYSLLTVNNVGTCQGMKKLRLENSHSYDENSVPKLSDSGYMKATLLDASGRNQTCNFEKYEGCGVNVIDSYTSSFHWAEVNFSAIWLRMNWFLLTDSFLSDILNGGLSMVSGGSYNQVPTGYWAMTRKSVFAGATQAENNDYSTAAGPLMGEKTGLSCDGGSAAYCRLMDRNKQYEGISVQTPNLSGFQKLVNIYDGPVYLDSVAFLDIRKTPIACTNSNGAPTVALSSVSGARTCENTGFIYSGGRSLMIPVDKDDPSYVAYNSDDDKGVAFSRNKNRCIFPNAAIGWKQPNGFYYPPAFHMKNLHFSNVDIRHFVQVPPFTPGTMNTDPWRLSTEYCSYQPATFNDLTDIDRQTEINDDDGSLSGISYSSAVNLPENWRFTGSISLNNDTFFHTPAKMFECLSQKTCFQTPYDHLNLAIIPDKATPDGGTKGWDSVCEKKECGGVLLYRQYRLNTPDDSFGENQGIRMMGAGISQRSVMIANNGKYYIDTALRESGGPKSQFISNQPYNFFTLYAKPTSNVTFQLYVGSGFDPKSVKMVQVDTKKIQGTGIVGKTAVKPLSDWPAEYTKYDSSKGILELTLNLQEVCSQKPDHTVCKNFSLASKENCQPATFCRWNENNKQCEVADNSGNPNRIDYTEEKKSTLCSSWAIKTPECPSGGCYGFQVTFPEGFDNDPNLIARNTGDKKNLRPNDPNDLFSNQAAWKPIQFDIDKGKAECTASNMGPGAYISISKESDVIKKIGRFEVTFADTASPKTALVNLPGGTITLMAQSSQDSYSDKAGNSLAFTDARKTATLLQKGGAETIGKLATTYLSGIENDRGLMEVLTDNENAYVRMLDARWFILPKKDNVYKNTEIKDKDGKSFTVELKLEDRKATLSRTGSGGTSVVLFTGNAR